MHCIGTLAELHARGRVIAIVRLIGSETGTFPVTRRQVQSTLLLIIDLRESQQAVDGEEAPFLVLPVIKFKHGVKVVSIEIVHGVLIWQSAETTKKINIVADTKFRHKNELAFFMIKRGHTVKLRY